LGFSLGFPEILATPADFMKIPSFLKRVLLLIGLSVLILGGILFSVGMWTNPGSNIPQTGISISLFGGLWLFLTALVFLQRPLSSLELRAACIREVKQKALHHFRSLTHTWSDGTVRNNVLASLENQPIFEKDNYEQIVERVANEAAPHFNLLVNNAYTNSLFYLSVLEKSNKIILDRLKAESDRVTPAIAAATLEELKQKYKAKG
jgi:hypothetical protein